MSHSQAPPANILELMRQLLTSMDITDYEPAVPHMLVELFYRHVTDVLKESQELCNARKSKEIDEEDLKRAINYVLKRSMRHSSSPDELQRVARTINDQPLPPVPDVPEMVLPCEETSLMEANFQLAQAPRT